MMTRPSLRTAGSALIAAAVLTSSLLVAPDAGATPRPSTAPTALQQALQQLVTDGVPGTMALIRQGNTTQRAAAGVANLATGEPMSPYDRYRVGSITKSFVSTVVLQLEAAGRLSLNDSVEKWLPGVLDTNGYNGSAITIRELLNHTSGIFDYTQFPSFQTRLLSAASFNQTRFQHSDPQQLVAQALTHPPEFAPGTNFFYSNTDYVLLGMVIKAVTGQTWTAQLYRRIIAPLHLTGTSVPGDNPFLPLPAIGGYNIYTSDPASRVYTDVTVENITWADAAGSIISTTADVNRFYHALFGGQLLSPALLAEMKAPVPGAPPSVGLGFGHQALDCGTEINGAVGLVPGYNTYVFSNDDGSRTVVLEIATSTFTEDQFDNDAANDAFNVIEHAFCP